MAVSVPTVLASGVLAQSGESSLETDEISPTAGALVIFVVAARGTASATHTITDSFSGGVGDWAQYTENQGDTRVSINIARASASPGSGTVTVTYDNTRSRQCWQLLEATDVDLSTPVAEKDTDAEVSTNLSMEVVGLETGNLLLGAGATRSGDVGITALPTEILDQDSGGGTPVSLMTAYTQTRPFLSFTVGDGDNSAAVVIELASATAAPQSTLTIVRQFSSPNAQPRGIAHDGRTLWMSDSGANLLYQIDPRTFTVLKQFDVAGLSYRGLAWDGARLWASEDNNDRVDQIDPVTGRILKSFDAPGAGSRGIAWDGRTLWVSDDGTDLLYQLDPVTGRVIRSLDPPVTGPQGLFFMGNTLWLVNNDADSVQQLTLPGMKAIRGFTTPHGEAHGMCWDGRHIWITESTEELVYQLAIG
jgi:glutamine cyclotransferase